MHQSRNHVLQTHMSETGDSADYRANQEPAGENLAMMSFEGRQNYPPQKRRPNKNRLLLSCVPLFFYLVYDLPSSFFPVLLRHDNCDKHLKWIGCLLDFHCFFPLLLSGSERQALCV